MEIRFARKEDINDIHNLLLQVNRVHYNGRPDIFKLGSKYNYEEISSIIEKNDSILVAVSDYHIVGYVFFMYKEVINDNILFDSKELYIDDLCVDENMRGKRIGEKLYNKIIEIAKENCCDKITLNVWELNKGAKIFYEKMGLMPLKTVMEYKL